MTQDASWKQDAAAAQGLSDEEPPEPPEPQAAEADKKWCNMCDEWLPLDEFKMTLRTNKHGEPSPYYSSMCIKDENTIESFHKMKKA